MEITVYSIAKKERSLYEPLYKELMKMASRYARIEDVELFGKSVTKAHTIGEEAAKQAYTKSFEPYLNRGYSIALHPDGKMMDSFAFSKLLSDRIAVQFYIGGAYGFEPSFLKRCDRVISLSPLTMSHKVAKVVLFEQIYRALTILANHPYHK
jgi:23S rRNA (pseudouridine1915-N3)-methyltransferase